MHARRGPVGAGVEAGVARPRRDEVVAAEPFEAASAAIWRRVKPSGIVKWIVPAEGGWVCARGGVVSTDSAAA